MPKRSRVSARCLLDWYDRHGRDLPWRARAPRDAYRVWLSEIMLQQTTVGAVIPYFDRFIARWPDVAALARADLDEVLAAWAGLGYYARARNLKACAERVVAVHGGRFPEAIEALRALPGIGAYTACAIAAIVHDRPVAAIDGNVERVIARLYGLETPPPRLKREVAPLAAALVPADRPGDFAQAMMDLGATVCRPRAPACGDCPWRECCLAKARGIARRLPGRKARKVRPVRRATAFWLERGDGHVLLRKRPPDGLLGGMLEVPSSPWLDAANGADGGDPLAHAPAPAPWRALAAGVRHTFTHFHLQLDIVAARKDGGAVLSAAGGSDRWRWVAIADLDEQALPSVMKKIAVAVRNDPWSGGAWR